MRELTPDLAAVLADVEAAVQQADAAELPALAGRLEALRAAAWARLVTPPTATTSAHGEDRLLLIDAAAERLGVTVGWLRRRPALPFVVKLSDGVVRYSNRGLDRFIRHHTQGDR